MDELTNCGICMVQAMDRVAISKACNLLGVGHGDYVEVYIRKAENIQEDK